MRAGTIMRAGGDARRRSRGGLCSHTHLLSLTLNCTNRCFHTRTETRAPGRQSRAACLVRLRGVAASRWSVSLSVGADSIPSIVVRASSSWSSVTIAAGSRSFFSAWRPLRPSPGSPACRVCGTLGPSRAATCSRLQHARQSSSK